MKMEFLKFIQKHIYIILICFVSPCYQLINEIQKGTPNNAIGNNPGLNANNVNKIITTRRQPVKTSPIHIVPQPLITRRTFNSIDSAKSQSIANNKIPTSIKVKNEETPKINTVKSNNIEKNVEPESKHKEKFPFYEDEDMSDIDVKSIKNNVKNSKPEEKNEKNKSNETEEYKAFPKFEEKIVSTIIEPKEVVKSGKLETYRPGNDSKNAIEEAKDKMANKIIQELKLCDEGKPKKTENVPASTDMTVLDKKKYFRNKDEHDQVKSTKDFEPETSSTNFRKPNFVVHANIPRRTMLKINVDPKLMEKLTNDAKDKILIKDCQFVELREKYKPLPENTFEGDETDVNDNLSKVSDRFWEQNTNIENEIDFNIVNGPNVNDYFKNYDYRKPNDRIWRQWKNTEIHIKPTDDIEPDIMEEPKRDICDCYSNIEFSPVEFVANKLQPAKIDNSYHKLIQNPTTYYSPAAYSSSFPSCYQPRSYGYPYAPVSRYQNYLFPCL